MTTIDEHKLLFARASKDVKIPCKDSENAGYDIYAYFKDDYIIIPPHATAMIPTGLHSAFNEKWVMILKERGSTGTKGMGQRAGIIDSGFRAEIFVPITNTNDIHIVIIKEGVEPPKFDNEIPVLYPYSKAICQAIMVEVPVMEVEEIPLDELKAIPSRRGEGCIGSSNK